MISYFQRYVILFLVCGLSLVYIDIYADENVRPDKTPDSLKSQKEKIDVAKYVEFNGTNMTYDDALPVLEAMISNGSKSNRLVAIKTLRWYGDSIANTALLGELINIYRQTQSPPSADTYDNLPDQEMNLEIKGELLSTIVASGDKRRDNLLLLAKKDRNVYLNELANQLLELIKTYDHFTQGGTPVKTKSANR